MFPEYRLISTKSFALIFNKIDKSNRSASSFIEIPGWLREATLLERPLCTDPFTQDRGTRNYYVDSTMERAWHKTLSDDTAIYSE